MNKSALKALKASIDHWYRISVCMTREALIKEGYDGDQCPLCWQFTPDPWTSVGCQGCPVQVDTGKDYCHGSPYAKASESLTRWVDTGIWFESDQANVEAEIRYLEGLLP